MSPRLLGCTFTLVYAGTLPVVSNRLSYTYICDLQHMEREGHSVGKRLTALISVGDACASPCGWESRLDGGAAVHPCSVRYDDLAADGSVGRHCTLSSRATLVDIRHEPTE